MAKRVLFYAALAVLILVAAVHVKMWFADVAENPYVTLYRTKVVWKEAEPTKDWKKAEKVTVPCVKVQALATGQSGPSVDLRARTPDTLDTDTTSSTLDTAPGVAFPLLLGEWKLPPMPWGGTARATLDEAGETHLETKPSPRSFLELGRFRQVTAWYGRTSDNLPAWAIEYDQDVVRVGPAILRARVSYSDPGIHEVSPFASVALGVSVRF